MLKSELRQQCRQASNMVAELGALTRAAKRRSTSAGPKVTLSPSVDPGSPQSHASPKRMTYTRVEAPSPSAPTRDMTLSELTHAHQHLVAQACSMMISHTAACVCAHTRTHTCVCVRERERERVCVCAHPHTRLCAGARARTQTHACAHTAMCAHVCVSERAHTRVCARMRSRSRGLWRDREGAGR